DTFSRELETEDEEWGYIPEEDSRWEFDYRARYVLSRAGYTNTFIDESMAACYQMEDMLIAAFDPQKYEDNAQYTMAELSGRCKAFPIAEVLRAYNVNSDSMIVTYIDILEKLGELYTEENLSLLKGYLTAHIAAMACARLDFEAQAIAEGFYTYDYSDEAEPLSDEEILEALNENARQLAISPFGLTGVALENAYITNYTEPEEKKDLMRLTLLIRDSFKELLQNEPWMSQESRDNAVKKLEAMTFNIVSPDELIDASYLLMDKNETYLTASMDAAMRKQLHDNAYIGTELDRNGNIYDIVPSSSTTITNSFNFQDFNRFFICGGIIGEGFYTKDMSEEEKLAAIGAVIGHEMTHGFDPDGVQYDSEGVYIATEDRPWGFFTEADHNVFKEKVSKMETYFNKIWPFPEAHCDGELLTGEATADMGGIAIALNIAKDIEGFDYDRYFRAYSNVWKSQGTYENELWDMFDEHPLNYIRINATLQQFDEFLDTYGIKEGDGMYLPLEERVKIW
ncbi:MAG TPA: hypothetical protein DCL38_03545, partial [Lachnospiraceae bacterium]|nr:hypothetical protein [Lachnospiraceae bacterium]